MFLIINYQFVNAALNANAFQNLFECVSVEIDSIQIERESFQLNSGYMLRLEACLTCTFLTISIQIFENYKDLL